MDSTKGDSGITSQYITLKNYTGGSWQSFWTYWLNLLLRLRWWGERLRRWCCCWCWFSDNRSCFFILSLRGVHSEQVSYAGLHKEKQQLNTICSKLSCKYNTSMTIKPPTKAKLLKVDTFNIIRHTCWKNSVVNPPPSMAISPSNFFWCAFFRIFSSTVLSQINLKQATTKNTYSSSTNTEH